MSITPEVLASIDFPRTLSLHPKGTHVVYSARPLTLSNKNFISTIWLAKVGEKGSSRQLTFGHANDHTPKWNPAGNSITFISDRADPSKSSALYHLPLEGGEAYPITEEVCAVEVYNHSIHSLLAIWLLSCSSVHFNVTTAVPFLPRHFILPSTHDFRF